MWFMTSALVNKDGTVDIPCTKPPSREQVSRGITVLQGVRWYRRYSSLEGGLRRDGRIELRGRGGLGRRLLSTMT